MKLTLCAMASQRETGGGSTTAAPICPFSRKGGRRWRTYVPKEVTLRQRGTIPVA